MIDMNRLLIQVMGGDGSNPDLREDNPNAVDRACSPSMVPQTSNAAGLIGHAGALGTGALAGGLAGLLFGSKRVREVAGTAVQIGAVAAIGGLAYKAYQNYQQGKPIVPQGITDILAGGTQPQHESGMTQHPVNEAWFPQQGRSAEVGRLLLRSMVAAAAADGHLDEAEYGRVNQQLRTGGLNDEEQFFLSQIIMRPNSIAELAAEANTPELRAEVYAAALLAIDPDAPVEREWLGQLAAALSLEPGLKAHLDAIGGASHARAVALAV